MELPQSSDEQLMQQHLRGERAAFELLVQRYLKALYNFIFKYVHTATQAEDLTQEVFLKIWQKSAKFKAEYKFKPWAYTIAKNTALDYLKKKELLPFSSFDNAEMQQIFEKVLVSDGDLPEQAIQRIEDVQMIGHAIAKIPEKYQQVLDLYYQKEFNFREIAELLKESVDTVKTRHRRALLHLKKQFIEQ